MPRASSLKLRLIVSSSVWVITTLLITALLLLMLFRTHIERRFDAMLYDHLEELVAASELDDGGSLSMTWRPFDPRFNRPHSGWYWQVSQDQAVIAGSDSLWREQLAIAPPEPGTNGQIQTLIGPAAETLRALVQAINLAEADHPLTFAVAGPVSDIKSDIAVFSAKLALTLGIFALGLFGAVLLQIHLALKPFTALRNALVAIRAGHTPRMPASFPREVQPIVTELNTLLDHNTAVLERARTQADDLAHALKNPLTVIRNEARGIGGEHGTILRDQALAMGATIDRYLSHARAAGARSVLGARAAVVRIVDDLRFSLDRLYRERNLSIQARELDQLTFQGDVQDLEEMLGNLMDNACKWARSKVLVRGERNGAFLRIMVEDDGPGIPPGQQAEVLQRGRRLDSRIPGDGLGLAIVCNIAELYHGSLTLDRSALGGLCARLELPAANP